MMLCADELLDSCCGQARMSQHPGRTVRRGEQRSGEDREHEARLQPGRSSWFGHFELDFLLLVVGDIAAELKAECVS